MFSAPVPNVAFRGGGYGVQAVNPVGRHDRAGFSLACMFPSYRIVLQKELVLR